MVRRVLIINGHPDGSTKRFCAAICEAYAVGAEESGRSVRRLNVAALQLPQVLSAEDFIGGPLTADAQRAQDAIRWADHLVFVYPIWLGTAPALFKTFCEQVFRYGFAIPQPGGRAVKGLLHGRSARLIVTMGTPALIFRMIFGAFGVRSFERGVLQLAGVRPVRRTLIGDVERSERVRQRWLRTVRNLGRRGL